MIPIYTHVRVAALINDDGSPRSIPRQTKVHTFDPVADGIQVNREVGCMARTVGGSDPALWVELPGDASLVDGLAGRPDPVVMWLGKPYPAKHVHYFALLGLHGFRRVDPADVVAAGGSTG